MLMDKGITLSPLDSVASVLGSCAMTSCGNYDLELSGFDNADSRL